MTIPSLDPGARASASPSNAHEGLPGGASGLAWQREMERAQRASWFQPPLTDEHVSPTGEPAQPARTAEPLPVHAMPGPSPWPQAASPAAFAPMLPTPAGQGPMAAYGLPNPAAPNATTAEAPPNTAAWARLQASLLALVDAHAGQGPAAAQRTSLTAPIGSADAAHAADIRVHLEPSPEGVRVWVGAPAIAHGSTGPIEALLQSLRLRLRQEGMDLHALTVNGRTVWRAPDIPPTPPAPTEE